MNAPAAIPNGAAIARALPPGVIALRPPGPKAAAFMASRAFAAGIMGPVGSGKTIACCQKVLRIGAKQTPRRDGNGLLIRHAKIIVVAKTYPVLDANLLPSWFRVVPQAQGTFSWDAPRSHHFQKALRKDRESGKVTEILDLMVEFRAIGDKSVEEALRGSECTAAWLYEADTLSEAVFTFLSGRVGRYAPLGGVRVVDPQIIGDLNACDIDNWVSKRWIDQEIDPDLLKAIEATLDGQPAVEFFQQPPAIDKDGNVNPNAENKANLDVFNPGYYERQVVLNRNNKNYLDRMLRNKLVPAQNGQPVYGDEFDYEDHVAEGELAPDPKRQLIVALDAGLTPAAAGGQRTSLGQLRVLFELVVFAEEGETIGKLGPTRFAEELRRYLLEHYPLHYRPATHGLVRRRGRNGAAALDEFDERDELIKFVCDPSAKDGTDKSGNEESWLEIVQAILGYPVRPAKTNKLHLRLEAVRRALKAKGGFIISRSCKILRRGFISGYHYVRVAVGDSTGRFNSEPNKNQFSHVQDALQYLALEDEETLADLLGKDSRRGRRGRAQARDRVDFGGGYFSGGTGR